MGTNDDVLLEDVESLFKPKEEKSVPSNLETFNSLLMFTDIARSAELTRSGDYVDIRVTSDKDDYGEVYWVYDKKDWYSPAYKIEDFKNSNYNGVLFFLEILIERCTGVPDETKDSRLHEISGFCRTMK